jgi:hypothetical protein
VCSTTTIPEPSNSIKVLSPNGGETIKQGQTVTIQWSSRNIPADAMMNIYLANSNGVVGQIATGINPNTNQSYSWNTGSPTGTISTINGVIPSYAVAGQYKIQLEAGWSVPVTMDNQKGYVGVTDLSDNYFTISSQISPAQNSITVLSPNGGETWQTGTRQTIKWQDNSPIPKCPTGAKCPQSVKTYDISLWPYQSPCLLGTACPTSIPGPYVITRNISGSSYDWNTGNIADLYDSRIGDGAYYVSVCQTGTSNCDSSDGVFNIASKLPPIDPTNYPPKIVGFPGIQTNIQPGQSVNISLSAKDADNDDLSWTVDWGENIGESGNCNETRRKTGTGWTLNKSHSWAKAGVYQVRVTVSDCTGGSDSYSFTVNVGAVTKPSITASPASGTLSGSSPTLWVDFVVQNYEPKGTELVDFGDGTKSALGYTNAYNSRHDYHLPGTYTVKLLSGNTIIAQTQVNVLAAQTGMTSNILEGLRSVNPTLYR